MSIFKLVLNILLLLFFLYFYEVVRSLPLETEAHSGPRRLTSANQDQAAYLRSDHFLSNQSGFEQIELLQITNQSRLPRAMEIFYVDPKY